MACRCQERRAAIQSAAKVKTVRAAAEAARFTVRTSVEDVRRLLVRRTRKA